MVSGASRGLGRAIAAAFAQSPHLGLDVPLEVVLLARSSVHETTTLMESFRRPTSDQGFVVHGYSIDLGNLTTLERNMDPIWDRHSLLSTTGQVPDRAVLINCAGTTGFIGRNPTSLQDIQQATDLNFTSKTWLSSRFIEQYSNSNTTVVNISSMCAVKPTPTMALYCSTAAGREMYHAVLAMTTHARILNYAPGSCDTNMQASLREHDALDPTVQAYCQSLVSEGTLIPCEDTAAELVRLVLEPDSYQSGERVEYVNMSAYKY